jgi:hypothetical protein
MVMLQQMRMIYLSHSSSSSGKTMMASKVTAGPQRQTQLTSCLHCQKRRTSQGLATAAMSMHNKQQKNHSCALAPPAVTTQPSPSAAAAARIA